MDPYFDLDTDLDHDLLCVQHVDRLADMDADLYNLKHEYEYGDEYEYEYTHPDTNRFSNIDMDADAHPDL